jgi:hypothetical protein
VAAVIELPRLFLAAEATQRELVRAAWPYPELSVYRKAGLSFRDQDEWSTNLIAALSTNEGKRVAAILQNHFVNSGVGVGP